MMGNARYIKLIDANLLTAVDEDDYVWAINYDWRSQKNKNLIYVVRTSFRETHYLHRDVALIHNIINSSQEVDHRNNDTLDNQKENLRPSTRTLSNANTRKQSRHTSSKFKGVYWSKGKGLWCAQLAGQYLGKFISEEEAARVYDKAAKQAYGEYAKCNF